MVSMFRLSTRRIRHRDRRIASGLLNLGCGRRRHPDWINADLVPDGDDVVAVDVRRPLPFAAGVFQAVYASHVLEHLTPGEASALVREVRRVLAPGGVVRIVVPDLEGIARAYVASLEAVDAGGGPEARWRHQWMTVELLDQLVRTRPGGVMRRWWSCDPVPCHDVIQARLGSEAADAIVRLAEERKSGTGLSVCPETILEEPPASPRSAARFAAQGERHRWMYDRVSMAGLLSGHGFLDPTRRGPTDSAIPGFCRYELDADGAGQPHKPDSLFMEAIRP